MPRRRTASLAPRAKEALILYVALNTENYDKYLDYCNRTGTRPFTKWYLRNWIQRNRPEIQRQRLLHLAEIKQASALTRTKRMAMLEDNARVCGERIATLLTDEHADIRLLTALMEQQRKLLEAIARERGEWGNTSEEPTDLEKLHKTLLDSMSRAVAPALPEPVAEGEFREIEAEAEVKTG